MILKAKNLSSSHRHIKILDAIDLQVNAGEMLIIIGPNGAGKSTLLNKLANETARKEDAILFKDKQFVEWDARDLAHHKAKFSQSHSSEIGLQVKDIVLMGRYPYFDATPDHEDLLIVEQAMKATEVFESKERQYNTLSGGEKQRVHLARVLAQLQNGLEAKLAFFDEPLNNLDVRHQYHILETIRQFTDKGNSAILVLHDLNLAAEFADKVLLLKNGKLVAHGLPEHIFQEDIISKSYNFPCSICRNPITNNPMIIFKNRVKTCPLKF